MKSFSKILLLLLLIFVSAALPQTTSVGVGLIKYYEGFQAKSYRCPANVLTIGYGHTGKDVFKNEIITKSQGEQLLIKDLYRFEKYVDRTISRNLKWHEFDAMVAFTFNVGYRLSGKYDNPVLRNAVNTGNTNVVIIKLKQYNKAKVNGIYVVLLGLVKRRNSETHLYSDANFKLSPYVL
jgi:lysozyme